MINNKMKENYTGTVQTASQYRVNNNICPIKSHTTQNFLTGAFILGWPNCKHLYIMFRAL